MAEARVAEEAYASGSARPLEGLPFTVKDTIETAGVRTTAGSTLLSDYIPAVDAPAVARLRAAGAILLGKSNVPEFAMLYTTDNDLFGRTGNPADPRLTAGGSSGGEAAIIAAGGSPLGLGSDMGGSIRVPAAFCGVAGLRPTPGRVPNAGHIPDLSWPYEDLTVVGPLAPTVDDIGLCMTVLDEGWRQDVNVDGPVAVYELDGVVPVMEESRHAVREAAVALGEQVSIEHVRPPHLEELYGLWDELWVSSGGAAGLLDKYLQSRSSLSRGLVRLMDATSTMRDAARLRRAWSAIQRIRADVDRFLERHPLVLCPVAAGPAGERSGSWDIDGTAVRGSGGFGYSFVWSLMSCPAIAVPWKRDGGRPPIAVQVVGRPGHDEEVVAAGQLLERVRGPLHLASPGGCSIY